MWPLFSLQWLDELQDNPSGVTGQTYARKLQGSAFSHGKPLSQGQKKAKAFHTGSVCPCPVSIASDKRENYGTEGAKEMSNSVIVNE